MKYKQNMKMLSEHFSEFSPLGIWEARKVRKNLLVIYAAFWKSFQDHAWADFSLRIFRVKINAYGEEG